MTTLTDRIAYNLVGNYRVTLEDLEADKYLGVHGAIWSKIFPEVRKMKPSVLGIIVSNVPTPSSSKWSFREALAEGDLLADQLSGRECLRTLATAALLCKMHEILVQEAEAYDMLNEMKPHEDDPLCSCGDPMSKHYNEEGYCEVPGCQCSYFGANPEEYQQYHEVWFTEGPMGHRGYE